MKIYSPVKILIFLTIVGLSASPVWSRASIEINNKDFQTGLSSGDPAHAIVAHRIGQLVLSVNNNGTFGTGFASSVKIDYFTGQATPSCEFPKNSNIGYLFAGAFWIGAVVGRDTLVSVAADGWSFIREFFPDEEPFGNIIKRSITFPNAKEFEDAVSEEDYVMTYADTFTEGIGSDFFGRPHIPLNIEVTQKSYAWSYPYAEDFILFDYEIKNIGINKLTKVYMGIYVDADVNFIGGTGQSGYNDDICGFVETIPVDFKGCPFVDTINLAWIADNDGDPIGNGTQFNDESPTSVTGVRIVRTPADSLDVSFNWWISSSPALDFGPRERAFVGKLKEDFRDLGTGGIGTPEGDVNKYYFMQNREFDYDQIYSAVIPSNDTLWMEPPQDRAENFADGLDTRYLISFGPFDINPGEKLPISFAYVAGENFHDNPANGSNLPNNPEQFYDNLNFTDFGKNSTWASRVYDNPGVDTDNDGFAGKLRICCFDSILAVDTIITGEPPETSYVNLDTYVYTSCDSIFYEGDGVPDFKGASPPPAPDFWLEPAIGAIKVRFNGLRSETTIDIFSHIPDFEGYRIYIGRDIRGSSLSLTASYDIENFNKFVWNENKVPDPGYELLEIPYTLDSLRILYGYPFNDSLFDPLFYTRGTPYIHPLYPDSIFFFEPQDFNVSELGVTTPIIKKYPTQPFPSTLIPENANPDELTDDGYLKYFEYELTIENLLPTVQWWVNVTAFDFGSPESDLKSLESSKSTFAKAAFPQSSADNLLSGKYEVYVYPNPYRFDGNYRNLGYEGVETDENSLNWGEKQSSFSDDKVRKINFANLPSKCTIRIYSLDGDLVREIIHDKNPSNPNSTHDEWDLITRNTQLVVSGLYYWTIESENGDVQIGKLVIIM